MSAVRTWLAAPMPRDVGQAIDRLAAAPGVRRVAVMPDVHLAEHVCVGVVVGTEDWLYPQAVGGDIGCGIAAVRVAGDGAALDQRGADRLLAVLRHTVPAVRQRRPRDAALGALSDPQLQRRIQRDADIQLGTLGRGNHFLELQRDEQGALWLMVHSGSRAVGPAIRDHHLARAEPAAGKLLALRAVGPGADYLHDAAIAIDYAARNRRAIAQGAAQALGDALGWQLSWDSWFEVTHNFARAEVHDGARLWVHRKGASPAFAGEPGIVPGSMGDASFHVTGRGCPAALCSSAHGAGRRLRRGEATRTISTRQLERSMAGIFFDRDLAPRLRDEAPAAYKDIGAVMRAQRELVRVERRLQPVLAYKGA